MRKGVEGVADVTTTAFGDVYAELLALVMDARPNDEMTDPAGNSGARIGCGVIKKS